MRTGFVCPTEKRMPLRPRKRHLLLREMRQVALIVRLNERVNARQDFRPETRAVEYAEMADARLQQVRPAMLGNIHA